MMVNRNGRGPEDKGPRTGRGLGPCRESMKEGGKLWKNKREHPQHGTFI